MRSFVIGLGKEGGKSPKQTGQSPRVRQNGFTTGLRSCTTFFSAINICLSTFKCLFEIQCSVLYNRKIICSLIFLYGRH